MPKDHVLRSASEMLRREGIMVVINVSEPMPEDNAHRWGHGITFKPTKEQAETLAQMVESVGEL